jgi:predicted nucleic acid-binding protein
MTVNSRLPAPVFRSPGCQTDTAIPGRLYLAGEPRPRRYFAALAIESGSEWITTDRDYARFRGLRWRHPLAA